MRGKRRKKSKKQKAFGQRIHAKRRLYERYGFDVNKTEYEKICNKIKSNDGWYLKKLTNRLSLWLVLFKEEYLFTVYDKHRGQIATFLTLEMGQVKDVYAECGIPLELEDEIDPEDQEDESEEKDKTAIFA